MNKISQIIAEQKSKVERKSYDAKCPFTGNLKLRGKSFTGVVVSKDTHHTAQVEWTRQVFIKKYERFMVRKTKIAVHNPDTINAQIGDLVLLSECRPLSKTKKFVIVKNLGKSLAYVVKREVIEADKKIAQEARTKKEKVEEDTHASA